MTTPISFELAKLLKEKGFDIPCREGWVNYLASFTGETRMPDDESNLVMDTLGNRHLIERPTIAEVVMCLYKKHGIWIEVSLTDNSRSYYFDYTIITSKDRDFNDENCFDSAKRIYDKDKHNSPTEAYKAAIEYCLTKLI